MKGLSFINKLTTFFLYFSNVEENCLYAEMEMNVITAVLKKNVRKYKNELWECKNVKATR